MNTRCRMAPAAAGGIALYTFGFNQLLKQDFGQARVDHILNDRHQLFVRYTYDGADQRLPTDYPQFPRDFLSRNQFVTANLTQTLSERTLNNVRLGFSRTRIGQDVEANTSQAVDALRHRTRDDRKHRCRWIAALRPARVSEPAACAECVWRRKTGSFCSAANIGLRRAFSLSDYQDNMVNPTFSLGQYTFNDLASFLQNRPARFIGSEPNWGARPLLAIYIVRAVRAGRLPSSSPA